MWAMRLCGLVKMWWAVRLSELLLRMILSASSKKITLMRLFILQRFLMWVFVKRIPQLPVLLARASRGMKLIYFSSDQVYTGTEEFGPYTEDMAKPDNTYARHKLEMEQRVLDLAPDAVMLRAEWMYDYHSPKSNYFINMLQARGSVCGSSRQFRGVTYVKEVAENMERVMNLPGGVYNFGSETSKSVYAITKEFLSFLGRDIPVEDMAPGHNLWMNCDKAKKYGVMFSSVEDGLRKCAEDYNLLK